MATHIQGRRSYDTQSSRIIPNVLSRIILIDEDIIASSFLAFFSKVKTMTTNQEKFTWDVDEFLAVTDTTAEAVSSTTQETINVSNPKYFLPNQTWVVKRTGEVLLIRQVNTSTSQLTVTRAVTASNSSGGTAAAAIVSGDTLVKQGPAVSENSTRQGVQTTTPSEQYNYAQMFRWELSLSDRQIKRQFETGDELPYQEMKVMKEARMALNRTFLTGERARFTDSLGDDVTMTRGMKNVPTSYTWSVGGTLNEYDWDEFLVEEGLRRGSANKMIFASTNFILALSEMAKDRLSYATAGFGPYTARLGLQVMEYMAPNGRKVGIVEDRHLSDAWNGTAIGVDMTELKRRTFTRNGRSGDLHVKLGTGDPDDLGQTNTLYADMGLQWGPEQHHFLITTVEGGAKGRALS